MNSFQIHFTKLDQAQDFKQLARELDGTFKKEDLLQLSGKIASGTIKKFHLDAGLYMRCWNLQFHSPVELCKDAFPTYVANNSFTAMHILTPESCQVEHIGEHHQFNRSHLRHAVFVSDNVNMKLNIQPYQPVQLIDFSITTYWLLQHFKKNRPDLTAVLLEAGTGELPIVFTNICSGKISLAVTRLLETGLKETEEAQLQPIANSIITDLVEKAIHQNRSALPGRYHVHYQKILEAESILEDHLQKNLPTLDVIAQQVALSESTLKRYFKIVYGKSIYEYYLEKKMQLARSLLLENPYNVNEIANMLGYEKVSNFIEIFKKHHGQSPGLLKKIRYSPQMP